MDKCGLGIQWHITSNCLKKCKHCYMFDDNYKIQNCSFEEFNLMFQSISRFCRKYNFEDNYILTGGSPLLNPYHEQIFDLLHNNNKIVNIMDIPEMINESNINKLKKYEIYECQLSLDGLSLTHDYIRGAGSFESTLSACKKLSDNDINPSIMFTASKHNYKELIPLCNYLIKHLNKFIFSYDFVVCTKSATFDDISVPVECIDTLMEEYLLFANKANQQYKEICFDLKPTTYRAMMRFKNNKRISLNTKYTHISGCHIGWSSICILENGDVLPCRRLPIVLGNLKQTEFEDIFLQSPLLKKFRRFNKFLEGCNDCEYSIVCKGCPAITYGITGNCFGKYPYCFYSKKKEYEFDEKKVLNIGASNDEEVGLIRRTFDNQMRSANANDIILKNPKILKGYAIAKSTNSERIFFHNFNLWEQLYNYELKDDEQAIIRNIFNNKALTRD